MMVMFFIFLILENIIEQYLPFFRYFDEIITILLVSICFLSFIKSKRTYRGARVVGYISIVILIGTVSTITYNIQKETIAIVKDVLAFSKFFVAYFFSLNFMKKKISYNKYFHMMYFCKSYMVILAFFAILNQFFDIGMDAGYRWKIKTFQFLYSHSTFMVASVVIIITILIADGKNKNRNYIFMGLLILIFSGRMKAYIYIVTFLGLNLFLKNHKKHEIKTVFNKKNKKRLFITAILTFLVAVVLTKDKVADYIYWGMNAARPALYLVGIHILIDYFPLGSGFATFASAISGEYYSPLYYEYGINKTSGLRLEEGYRYISDTYWPYIFAQFGLFGFILYIKALIRIFNEMLNEYKRNYDCVIASSSLYVYLIVSCFVESLLTNAPIILLAFTITYYIKLCYNFRTKEEMC